VTATGCLNIMYSFRIYPKIVVLQTSREFNKLCMIVPKILLQRQRVECFEAGITKLINRNDLDSAEINSTNAQDAVSSD
jgi:hypothetical protein